MSHIQEIEKEFEEQFGKDSELNKFLTLKYGTHIHHEPVFQAIKDFLRDSHLKYLTNKRKELEGAKPFGRCSSCDECPCKMKYRDGYNLAKQEEIDKIDKEIKQCKK